jgi:hypothetical protein
MTDLFDENNKPKEDGTPAAATPTDGVTGADAYLSLIVNEDGTQKYSTAEEALKGGVHAQSHIKNLETELSELRANADKGVDMEKILEALRAKPDDKSGEQAPAGLTADDVASQLETLLDKRDTATTTQANITTVTGVFKKLYGEKASETMYGKAKDLGFSQDEINGMIATNPNATLKILGVDKEKVISNDPITDGGGHVVDLSGGKPTEKPVSVMGATNSKDLTDAWKLSKEATNKRLGGVETLT